MFKLPSELVLVALVVGVVVVIVVVVVAEIAFSFSFYCCQHAPDGARHLLVATSSLPAPLLGGFCPAAARRSTARATPTRTF